MRVLIIEDDSRTADYVSDALQHAGFACTCAADGEEGLAALLGDEWDVVVSDVMLPKLDGLAVIRSARAAGRRVPVIFLSALGSVESKVSGLEAGGDDYLAKPFSVTELVARVQALVRRATPAAGPSELRVDDLVFNLVTRRATRGGRKLALQPLETRLLEYLMRNQGRVVSKTTILDRVWDYSFSPHTNAVEVCVCRLRDKIDAGSSVKLLHTVRKFGYVLEPREA